MGYTIKPTLRWPSAVQLALALALALASCTTAAEHGAATPPEWRRIDDSVRAVGNLAELEALVQDIPWSRHIHLTLMNGYLEADRKADAFASIERLIAGGHEFSSNGQRALLGLFDGAERDRLAEIFATERPAIEASEVVAKVPVSARLVEAAALDRATGRLFAGSIVSQGLFVKPPGSADWSRVPLDHAGGIGGMLIDEKHRTLWVASGVYEETPEPEGAFSGLIGVSLDGAPERRIPGPEGSTPSDLMLAADGTLYAADPVQGAIYRALPGEEKLSVLVGPGTFRSPQGMVEVGDKILVSDWGYGLAVVDPSNGQAWRVDPAMPLLLDGIDGMWRHGNEIVAIQNGARPARIVAFRLSPDATKIVAWRVIERGVAAWTDPGSGSLAGDTLLYVGNGQWDRYGAGGVLKQGRQAEPTEIRRLKLSEKPILPPKNGG